MIDQLTQALVRLAGEGQRPRCGDPEHHDYWTSEKPQEREWAAHWCTGCPVLRECDDAARDNGEKFGVWGGLDRTPQKKTAA